MAGSMDGGFNFVAKEVGGGVGEVDQHVMVLCEAMAKSLFDCTGLTEVDKVIYIEANVNGRVALE